MNNSLYKKNKYKPFQNFGESYWFWEHPVVSWITNRSLEASLILRTRLFPKSYRLLSCHYKLTRNESHYYQDLLAKDFNDETLLMDFSSFYFFFLSKW